MIDPIEIFFEIHSNLAQEGPGSNRSTLKALRLLDLPAKPLTVLDIGCGPGRQTFALAEALDGTLYALDNHEPYLTQLKKESEKTPHSRED
ncbi:MAG: class I SAM-dependent methyltransferase [Bdellovibrionota bacterium]